MLLVKNDVPNGTMGHFLLSLWRVVDFLAGEKSSVIKIINDHGDQIEDISSFWDFEKEGIPELFFSSCYMKGDAFSCVLKQDDIDQKRVQHTIYAHRMGALLYPQGINYPKGRKGNRLDKDCLELELFKKVFSKLCFKKELMDKVDSFHEVGPETLGVHVRLTDMNFGHPEYGVRTIQDYIKAIEEVHHKYKNIFVSSDNFQSAKKLKDIYGDKLFLVPCLTFKNKIEDDGWFLVKTKKFADIPEAWFEVFLETFLLSKCGFLIGRNSAVSLAAILFSKNMNLIEQNKILSDTNII